MEFSIPNIGTNTILDPFTYFPFPLPIVDANPDFNKRLVCGFNLGTSNFLPGEIGATGCGLYSILSTMVFYDTDASNGDPFLFPSGNPDFFAILSNTSPGLEELSSPAFIIGNSSELINFLNRVNNFSNYLIWQGDKQGRTDPLASQIGNDYSEISKFLKNYLFYGAYTGAQNVDVNNDGLINFFDVDNDLTGNGITGAFGFAKATGEGTDVSPRDGFASRAGIELYSILHYLKYGGIAILAGSWKDLYVLRNKKITVGPFPDLEIESLDVIPSGIDCFVTLEGGSMLTGVNDTNNNTDDGMIYGGAYYSADPTIGATVYNLTQGLLPEYLGNTFAGNGYRGNLFSCILAESNDPDPIPIFHSGLSGTSFGYKQIFEDSPESANRHPSTNGINFQYRRKPISLNYNTNPGTTFGILNNNQIQRLCCVAGKTLEKFYWTTNGTETGEIVGGGEDGSFWIPKLDVIEFVGSLNLVKQQSSSGKIFESNIGPSFPIPTSQFAIASPIISITSDRYSVNSSDLQTLIPKRINFLAREGYFPTDLVGFTGESFVARNRRNVETVYSFVYKTALDVLNQFTGNFLNTNETRSAVVTTLQEKYNQVSLNNYLRIPYQIQCDSNNNSFSSPTLNVDITIAPKQTNIPGGSVPPLRFRVTGG